MLQKTSKITSRKILDFRMRQVLLRRNQWMNVYIAELKFPIGHSLFPRLCFFSNLSVCCQPFIAFTTSNLSPKSGKEKKRKWV